MRLQDNTPHSLAKIIRQLVNYNNTLNFRTNEDNKVHTGKVLCVDREGTLFIDCPELISGECNIDIIL